MQTERSHRFSTATRAQISALVRLPLAQVRSPMLSGKGLQRHAFPALIASLDCIEDLLDRQTVLKTGLVWRSARH